MPGPGYAPGTRMARMPDGTWVATSSQTGVPIENFVLVSNPQAQGGHLVLRDHLPADWQPGMALVMTSPGNYETRPFQADNAVGAYQYHDFSTGTGTNNFDIGETPATPPPETEGTGATPGTTPGDNRNPGTPGTTPPPGGDVGGLLPGDNRNPGVDVPAGPRHPDWNLPPPTPPPGGWSPGAELNRLLNLDLVQPPATIGRPAGYGTPDPSGGILGPPNSSPATYQYHYRPEFGMYAPTQLTGGSNPFYNAPNIPPPVQPAAPVGGPAVGGPQPFIPGGGPGGGAIPPGGLGEGGAAPPPAAGANAVPGLLGGASPPPLPAGMSPQQYMAMYGVMPPGMGAGAPPTGLIP